MRFNNFCFNSDISFYFCNNSITEELNEIKSILDNTKFYEYEKSGIFERINSCFFRIETAGEKTYLQPLAYTLFSGKRVDRPTPYHNFIIQRMILNHNSKIEHVISLIKSRFIYKKQDWITAGLEMVKEQEERQKKTQRQLLTFEKNLKRNFEKGEITDKEMQKEFEEFKEYLEINEEMQNKKEEINRELVNTDSCDEIKKEKYVWILHGGGKEFIKAFLFGKILGYEAPMEYAVKAIFVTPNIKKNEDPMKHNKSLFYANRGCQRHFGTPIIFQAEIPEECLEYNGLGRDERDRGFELGKEGILRQKYVKYLKNLEFSYPDFESVRSFSTSPPSDEESIRELFPDIDLKTIKEVSRILKKYEE
jgi:hypothetical protein